MLGKQGWDTEFSQKELIFQDASVSNGDGTPKIACLAQNVCVKNTITLLPKMAVQTKGVGNPFEVMVGVCDRKVRKERGMIFQDKSFVGHGLYALYSIRTNSFLFSHWDLETNYNEGGFPFKDNEELTLKYIDNTLIIQQRNQQCKLRFEHNKIEDMYFCAVVGRGEVAIVG